MDSSTRKMQKKFKNDCKQTEKCVLTDWYDIFPMFDDRQFERAFHLRKVVAEVIIGKLIQHDWFWAHTHDCCGELGISLYVTFLTSQKMICYSDLFSPLGLFSDQSKC